MNDASLVFGFRFELCTELCPHIEPQSATLKVQSPLQLNYADFRTPLTFSLRIHRTRVQQAR
jgi:hypothetical protein